MKTSIKNETKQNATKPSDLTHPEHGAWAAKMRKARHDAAVKKEASFTRGSR